MLPAQATWDVRAGESTRADSGLLFCDLSMFYASTGGGIRTYHDANCPAVAWATRTTIRRVGSRVVCPAVFALARRFSACRIAIHPFDMDFPATTAQVGAIVASATRAGPSIGYDDLFAND